MTSLWVSSGYNKDPNRLVSFGVFAPGAKEFFQLSQLLRDHEAGRDLGFPLGLALFEFPPKGLALNPERERERRHDVKDWHRAL